jgi:thiamine biosynthesis lipoprotein
MSRPENPAVEHESRMELFGTSVRVLSGPPALPGGPAAEAAAAAAERVLRDHHAALSRFDPASELSRLNRDPNATVRVSELTADAVAAALWAAAHSGGLVDPTLLPALEQVGYERSRAGAAPAPLRAALYAAPSHRPAGCHPEAAWRRMSVDGRRVRRPPGVRLDLGGSAKGLAADKAAAHLSEQTTFAVDAGGDIVVGGVTGTPRRVAVAHPLEPRTLFEFDLSAGAVATSGLDTRLWETAEGFAHHLLDPSSGQPAWTGVIQATALGSSALEAEVLAKMALLSGPEAGAAVLEATGGVLVLDDGEAIVAGLLRERMELAA